MIHPSPHTTNTLLTAFQPRPSFAGRPRNKATTKRSGPKTNRLRAPLSFKPSNIFRHPGPPAIKGVGLFDPSDPNCFGQMDLAWSPSSRAGQSPHDRFQSIYLGPGKVATLATTQDARRTYEDRVGLWRLPSRTGKDWLKRLKAAFAKLAEETKDMHAGTTLVAGIISPDKRITLGWVGDSEAHWGFVDRKKIEAMVQQLTPTHSIKRQVDDGHYDDLQRIIAAGGEVSNEYRLASLPTTITDNSTNPPTQKSGRLTVPMTRFFGGKLFPWAIREGEFAQHDYSRLPIRPGPQGIGGYLILNSDGIRNPSPGHDFSEWGYFLKQADQRVQGITSPKQLANAPHPASWLLALSEVAHGGDNKSGLVVPLPDGDIKPKDRRHYPSLLALIADGHSGKEAAEYVFRRLPQLLSR